MVCGGLWAAQRKERAGLAQTKECPFCGKAVEELKHLFLCESHAADEGDAREVMKCVREGHIPEALLTYPIAPPLVADGHQGLWWGTDPGSNHSVPEMSRGSLPPGLNILLYAERSNTDPTMPPGAR